MKSAKELFIETRDKLIKAKLIHESSIETTIIKYKLDNEDKVYDLSRYIQDYYALLQNVPTTVSDSSYVLKKIPNIKELITSLSESFKQPENSSVIDIEHNIEVQLLSKMFSEEKSKTYLVRYVYYQAFSEWLKGVFAAVNYLDYECQMLSDEGCLSHNVRVLGEALYDLLGAHQNVIQKEIVSGGNTLEDHIQ